MLPRSGDDLVDRFFRIGARAPWHAYLSKTSAESFSKSRVFQRWVGSYKVVPEMDQRWMVAGDTTCIVSIGQSSI
jgi:hypothetical protein